MKLIFTWISCLCYFVVAAQPDVAVKKVEMPTGYVAHFNTVYKTVNDWKGEMDIYSDPTAKQAMPLLINIHGGGWNTGSKEMDSWFGSYFKKGFAVANINYRLAGTAPAPAAVEDARCALIYLVNRAKELNINTSKIVLCGTSSGGHLALLAAMLGNNPLYNGGCKPLQRFKIVAIIDKWGISDVYEWGFGAKSPGNAAVKRWLGPKAADTTFARELSPVNYINKTTPPVLIVHGDADGIVPVNHSKTLYQKLKEAGIYTELLIIPGGKHGNFGQSYNKEINDRLVTFLDHLNL